MHYPDKNHNNDKNNIDFTRSWSRTRRSNPREAVWSAAMLPPGLKSKYFDILIEINAEIQIWIF